MLRKEPIKIGVMGCASIAQRAVIPAIQTSPHLELMGVASRSAQKGEEFAREFNCSFCGCYEDLLSRDDVEAIYMPLPTGLHREWVPKALRAGKHLLVEKSLAMSLAEAREFSNLACDTQRIMMENYMFAYHAQQTAVKSLIQRHLGEIRLFRATFCFPPLPANNFRYDKALGGGALLDAGGYPLKACQVFMDTEIRVLGSCLNNNEAGVDIWGGAFLTAKLAGTSVPLQIAFGFDQYYQCGIEVLGQTGHLTTKRTFTAGKEVTPTALLETGKEKKQISLPHDNHFERILEEFVRRIERKDVMKSARELLAQAQLQDDVRHLAGLNKESSNDQ